jgi:nucleoside-diphosphate-sugar epimerase
MKIFLTGQNGFIGKNIRKFYSNESVYCYDRTLDLMTQLETTSPDVIVNCAGEIYDSSKMWASNVGLVRTLLNYCKLHETYLVQFGSSSEYGEVNEPTNETHPLNGTTSYALSKIFASRICLQSSAKAVVIRPYSPFGWGEKSHRLFPRLYKSFVDNVPMQLKQGMHDFCHIDDFIEGVDLVIRSQLTGAINISSGIQTSNLEVLEIFKAVTNKPGTVTFIDEMTTHPVWQCDNTLIRSHGWYPKQTLEQGIENFLRTCYE